MYSGAQKVFIQALILNPPLVTKASKTCPKKMTVPKMLILKCRKISCCFCNLILLKKKLKVHIQRRHTSKTQDITASCCLQSVCVLMEKGAFLQFCSQHATGCVSVKHAEARRYVLIQSLMFCPVATNLPVALDGEILTDMEMVVYRSFLLTHQKSSPLSDFYGRWCGQTVTLWLLETAYFNRNNCYYYFYCKYSF